MKRIISILLVFSLMLSTLQITVFAADNTEETTHLTETTDVVASQEEQSTIQETTNGTDSIDEEVPSSPAESTTTDEPASDAETEENHPMVIDDTDATDTTEITTVASGICGAEGDNLTWTLDSKGTLTISGEGEMKEYNAYAQPWYQYGNLIKNIVIESGVVSVSMYAFHSLESTYSNLKTVKLHEGLTRIGFCAFQNCEALVSINLPNTLTSISDWAFERCYSLTEITIPANVTSIGMGAFRNCTSLKSVTFRGDIPSVSSSRPPFDGDTAVAFYPYEFGKSYSNAQTGFYVQFNNYFGGNLSWYCYQNNDQYGICGDGVIWELTPNGILTVGAGISGGDMVGEDGKWPWDNIKSKIKRINIEAGVTTIGANAFSGCSANIICFYGSAPTIDASAFSGVNATAYYSSSNNGWNESIKNNYGGSLNWCQRDGATLYAEVYSLEAADGYQYYLYPATMTNADIYADVSSGSLAVIPGKTSVTTSVTDVFGTQHRQSVSFEIPSAGDYKLVLAKNNALYVPYIEQVTVSSDYIYRGIRLRSYGDVDGDGSITVWDVTESYYAATESNTLDDYATACADVDQDGDLTVWDVTQLYYQVTGA